MRTHSCVLECLTQLKLPFVDVLFMYAHPCDLQQLTNTLQKKLNEVRREKSLLERQIEQEKKANADLQAQLNECRGNKLVAVNAEALEEEEEMEEED